MIDALLTEAATVAQNNIRITAGVVAFLAAYVLYGVLGKRLLGADDDFWERIRATIIPVLDTVAKRYGFYTYTKSPRKEFAGHIRMSEDDFERKLKKAGFLRQPLASLHRNERGWLEDGSWSRPDGIVMPVGRAMSVIPVGGPYLRRFLTSLDTVLATRQTHIVFYTEQADGAGDPRIHVYCHTEPNPLNPVMAFAHYQAIGFRPAPEEAKNALSRVGVDLKGGE